VNGSSVIHGNFVDFTRCILLDGMWDFTFVELEEIGQEVVVICFTLNYRGEKLALHCPEGGSNRGPPKYRPQASPHTQFCQNSFYKHVYLSHFRSNEC